MDSVKQYYFIKLNPSRPTFALDMSDAERDVMKQHLVYWTDCMNKGCVVAFGPVMDPKSIYGVGIISVDSEEQAKTFVANDPANGLNSFEYYPMRAILPDK